MFLNLSVSKFTLVLSLVFCCCIFLQESYAQQATPSIYIDPSSTYAVPDGTQAHPYHSWREIPNNNPTRIATFYFKRGTRLIWPITIYNPNTTATSYITFDAYGKGSNRLNFIGGTWTNEGNGVYSRTVGSTNRNLRAFYVNDAEQQEDYFYAYFVRKGYANVIPKNGPRAGKWVYNVANDRIYWKSTVGDPNSALAQWGTETDKPKIIGRIPINGSWSSIGNGIFSHVIDHTGPSVFFVGDPENSFEIPYGGGGSTPALGYWSIVGNTIYFRPTNGIAPTQAQYTTYFRPDIDADSLYMDGTFVHRGRYMQVKNIHYTGGVRSGFEGAGESNITIKNSLFSKNGHILTEVGANPNNGPGFGPGTHFVGSGNVIQDSEASSNHDAGFELELQVAAGQTMSVSYSDVWSHHNGEWGLNAHGSENSPATISVVNSVVEQNGNLNLVINNGLKVRPPYGKAGIGLMYGQGTFVNTVFGSNNGAAIQWTASVGVTTIKNSLFVDNNYNNNPVGSDGAETLYFLHTPQSPTTFKLSLFNNTFYEPQAGNIYQKWASDYFPAVEAKNNIFIAGTGKYSIEAQANPANNPNAIFDRNNIGTGSFLNFIAGAAISDINTWNNKSFVGTDITANPLFTNEVGKVFSLQSNSPMINAGVNVGLSSDILGNPIVGNPDIGAFEYTSGGNTGDLTPPAAPGGLRIVQ